ncbi:MAG: DUF2764 family protein [Phycisphaerae bacterium]
MRSRGENFYLITSLPSLGELGNAPPISAEQLLQRVGIDHPAREAVEAILLGDDLLQRESAAAGEIEEVSPAVLTPAQARDEEPLPKPMLVEQRQAPRVAADALWANYFHYVADVAAATGCEFLRRWVGFEVALRNTVAEQRATDLGLDASAYRVADDLSDEMADLRSAVNEWSNAPNPLDALRALDRARWEWMNRNDAWFSFSDDELAVYAARLVLLIRWNRLTEAEGEDLLSSAIL